MGSRTLTYETTGRITASMMDSSKLNKKRRDTASKVDLRVEETKTKLLLAGMRLFGQRGYAGVGLKELLQQVKVPKGSFYNYFTSKEDFAAQTIAFYGASFEQLMQQVISAAELSALQRFASLFEILTRLFEEKQFTEGCLVGDLSTELADISQHCRLALDKVMQQFATGFEILVRQGQAEGSIRRDIEAADLAMFSLDSWEGALIRMRLKKNRTPLEQSKRLILQYLSG